MPGKIGDSSFGFPFVNLEEVGQSLASSAAPALGAAASNITQWTGDKSNPLAALFNFLPGAEGLFGAAAQNQPGPFVDLLAKIFGVFVPQAQTQGSAHAEERAKAQTQGSFQSGAVSGRGSAEAEAWATADAKGRAWAGPDGVGAEGSAEARAGVRVQTAGELHTPLGSLSGYAGASAELYARGAAYVRANQTGAEAGATAEVGAKATAEAKANANLMGGLVTGEADALAEAGTGATATGRVGISYNPPTAIIEGSAGAFAGAHAGFSAKGGIGPLKYGIQAEAWAGVGVKAEFHAGMEDGKFKFSAGLGAALGIGAFLKVDFEIDFKDVGSAITGILGAGVAIVGGVVSAVVGVVGSVVKGIGDFFSNLFKGIASLFGGGKGDGSHALNLLNTFKPRFAPPPEQPKSTEVEEPQDVPEEPAQPTSNETVEV